MTAYTESAIASMGAKAEHPDPESRMGRLLDIIRKEVGAPKLPTWDEVFAGHFRYNLPAVEVAKLAVFNDNERWANPSTPIERVMRDVAAGFGGDNVLNPHAEVDPRRVVHVLSKIIAMGKLYNPVKAFDVTNLDAKSKKRAGSSEYQVFDGRHRVAALAILFGPKLRIPMWISEETRTEATVATLEANNVRATKNLEKVAVKGVEMEAAYATPKASFASMNGNSKSIARWVVGQTHIIKPSKVFTKVNFPVTERVQRGVYAVPITGYQEFVKHAMRSIKQEDWKDLDAFTPQMNLTLEALDILYNEIKEQDKTGDLRYYWTAYTAPAYGSLLAEALFMGKQKPEAAAKALAKKAAGFLKANGPEHFNRTPPSKLVDLLRAF